MICNKSTPELRSYRETGRVSIWNISPAFPASDNFNARATYTCWSCFLSRFRFVGPWFAISHLYDKTRQTNANSSLSARKGVHEPSPYNTFQIKSVVHDDNSTGHGLFILHLPENGVYTSIMYRPPMSIPKENMDAFLSYRASLQGGIAFFTLFKNCNGFLHSTQSAFKGYFFNTHIGIDLHQYR